jgi:hypothetical protein
MASSQFGFGKDNDQRRVQSNMMNGTFESWNQPRWSSKELTASIGNLGTHVSSIQNPYTPA